MAEQNLIFGFPAEDVLKHAAQLKSKNPLPGEVNVDQAIMAACFANGNKQLFRQMQAAQMTNDAALILKILESSKDDRFKENDLMDLRSAYDEDDKQGFCAALRRLAGDENAGSPGDAMEEF